MNRLHEWTGKYAQAAGLLLLGGILAAAGVVYWGVPVFGSDSSKNSPAAEHTPCHHATGAVADGDHCSHSEEPSGSSCCPPKAPAKQVALPLQCPAFSKPATPATSTTPAPVPK